MCKIDIHTHILPERIPNWVERFGYGGFIHLESRSNCEADMMIGDQFFRRIQSNCWHPLERIAEMYNTGIRKQVLSIIPVLFNYWAQGKHGLETSRYFNDYIAEVCQKHPDRYFGLATLPLQDPELACQEMERCANELGLQGIEIGSHVNDWNLDRVELYPVFEKAQELDMCVFVHPWDMMGKARMEKYWLPWLVGMPAETSLAICSMIFSGLFDKLPGLRVAFAHGGGSFPITIGRIKHGFDCRPDLVAIDNPISPEKYLGRFWVDSLVHHPKSLEFLIDLIGEDKVAFGSDYPFPLGDLTGGQWIKEMPLSDLIKEKINYRNAWKWLFNDKVIPSDWNTTAL